MFEGAGAPFSCLYFNLAHFRDFSLLLQKSAEKPSATPPGMQNSLKKGHFSNISQ